MSGHFNYIHCDVFADRPYHGNSLAVFPDATGLDGAQMLTITQELRHFESIFLTRRGGQIHARIFDLIEELPFAGHPLIGAGCVLHRAGNMADTARHLLTLDGGREVTLVTRRSGDGFRGQLDQGRPEVLNRLKESAKPAFADAFNLPLAQIAPLPFEVISTGLKYLIVPVIGGLAQARITRPDLAQMLAEVGAQFAYLFDVQSFEGRHWNNDGQTEDIATGSAAGVVGAYALAHGLVPADQPFVLRQGHFIGRPSQLHVTPFGSRKDVTGLCVAGDVAFVGQGKVVAP